METRGFRIGEYAVQARLGRGGMGEVWLAVRGDARFAVKTLLPHLADDARVVEGFLREAKLAASVSSPHVVRVVEFGQADGRCFLVQEYVDGLSLDRLLEHQRVLPPELAALVAIGGCVGLSALHEHEGAPIVHRDISPSNLMLSIDGAVKVTDFGIAKTAQQVGHTVPGMAKGKMVYMAPEQARTKPVDPRTDVFALGAVLYELLAGDTPYHERVDDYELLAEVVHGRWRPLNEVAPAAPEALVQVVHRAMANDPAKRWPTAAAMREALEQWVATLTDAPSKKNLGALVRSALAVTLQPAAVGERGTLSGPEAALVRAGDVGDRGTAPVGETTEAVNAKDVDATDRSGELDRLARLARGVEPVDMAETLLEAPPPVDPLASTGETGEPPRGVPLDEDDHAATMRALKSPSEGGWALTASVAVFVALAVFGALLWFLAEL